MGLFPRFLWLVFFIVDIFGSQGTRLLVRAGLCIHSIRHFLSISLLQFFYSPVLTYLGVEAPVFSFVQVSVYIAFGTVLYIFFPVLFWRIGVEAPDFSPVWSRGMRLLIRVESRHPTSHSCRSLYMFHSGLFLRLLNGFLLWVSVIGLFSFIGLFSRALLTYLSYADRQLCSHIIRDFSHTSLS